jgi:hypothetical protein
MRDLHLSGVNNIGQPRFPRRVLAAGLTSLLALPLFFVPVPLFLLMEIREPLATIAMYACSIGLSGAVSLAINRHWLGGTWSATGATMIGPYLVLAGLPLALGLAYLALARSPDRFIVGLCTLPLLGVAGPVIFAGTLWLIAVLARRGPGAGWRSTSRTI